MSALISTGQSMPIDMALNHGTYCSERALEVLRRHADPTALRFYAAADDGDLRAAIAAHVGVPAASILVANGSGPLIKSVIPYLVEARIRASPLRIARHLLFRSGYPLIVTSPTYSKVPSSAHRIGLAFESIELDPARGFALDAAELRARLQKRDGLVYLCSPNNPTGNLLIDRPGLAALLAEFPRSFFFIDEAYVDYVDDARRPQLADLTARHDNLLILRSFSFAHGLAGAHVGYAITHPALVATMQARATPHQVGRLNAELVMASLADPGHLPRVRAEIARERARLIAGLRAMAGIEAFESETNFVYCRYTDGRKAVDLQRALAARGLVIKTFEPVGATRFDEFFRFTVGVPAENTYLIEQLAGIEAARAA